MKLPNAEHATIPALKLTGYLLSDTHPEGAAKSAFFRSFGYNAGNWEAFATALAVHALEHEIAAEEPSDFGTRYVIEGALTGVDGRRPMIRAVWFIESGSDFPRFVTAYPLKGHP